VSLDGNLRVFSLTDIFQMLGMQRKSGMLTVEGPKDTIAVGFLTGRVVSVESSTHPLENRLGSLLVKAGLLSEAQLAIVLETQKKRQDRLGRLLVAERLVRPEDLREAFRIQVQRIVFGAFRWTDGRFRFSPQSAVDHDEEFFAPITTEAILLDAARTFDELPAAEQKISSNELVFRRAGGAYGTRLVTSGAAAGEDTLVVAKREAETWKWIDGVRTVGDIRERAFLPDLDVLKGISDLLDRGLIEEGHLRETPAAVALVPRPHFPTGAVVLWGLVAALGAFSLSFLPRNPANLFLRPVSENPPVRDLFRASSQARLLAVGRGVRVYYGTTGRYPRTLVDLVAAGVLDEGSLRDPYGRFYRYILRPEDGKFALYGRTSTGQIDLDLAHDGQLSPVSEPHPGGAARVSGTEKPPGVQVVR
jgi:hypothetical protein